MNIERLQRMITVLNHVAESGVGFDLGSWGDVGYDCGTVACACGYAGLDPEFQAQGFTLGLARHGRPDWTVPADVVEYDQIMKEGRVYSVRPSFGAWVGWRAVSGFFGVRACVATILFDQIFYRPRATSTEVADRIQTLLDVGEESFLAQTWQFTSEHVSP